ncbi:hypothetical protein [Globicatella sanguinis]
MNIFKLRWGKQTKRKPIDFLLLSNSLYTHSQANIEYVQNISDITSLYDTRASSNNRLILF